ncbi:MAG: lysoplasmalogenase family protein [Defluviitaleaceae bacterium]|nr:lysoplasmalogenase family protein [Defluviitaleaceae bacterium]
MAEYKFAFVIGCFIIAIFSYVRCYSKWDWAWLVAGLAFTVFADFFLVIRGEHLFGVAAFCFVHVCYIIRAVGFNKRGIPPLFIMLGNCSRNSRCQWGLRPQSTSLQWAKPTSAPPPLAARRTSCGEKMRHKPLCCFGLCCFALFWGFAFIRGSVILLAVIYACLFAVNIFLNAKTRRPRFNYVLVMAGLSLFALCDINVMLFNLSRYLGVSFHFSPAFTLIWVFYLPSQFLLAISSFRIRGFGKIPKQIV